MISIAIGQIFPSINDIMSSNYLRLDGQLVAQADYPELTAIVPAGWLVGGDIQLPDLREASLHGDDTTNVGDIIGENNVTLTEAQMPTHTHIQNPHQHTSDTVSSIPTAAGLEPALASLVTVIPTLTGFATATNQTAGQDEAHNNVPRSLAVHWWIVAR